MMHGQKTIKKSALYAPIVITPCLWIQERWVRGAGVLTEKCPTPATNGIRTPHSSPKLRAVPVEVLQSVVARHYRA
jgi:hypothetical protein